MLIEGKPTVPYYSTAANSPELYILLSSVFFTRIYVPAVQEATGLRVDAWGKRETIRALRPSPDFQTSLVGHFRSDVAAGSRIIVGRASQLCDLWDELLPAAQNALLRFARRLPLDVS